MIKPLRAWADKYRRRGKYTPVGVTFHWVMALLVLYQLYSGWTMQRYLVGADKLDAYKVHSEIGLALLLLGVFRLVWRLMVPGPINDADRQGLATVVAHLTHGIFYALFAVLPLTGWILWSSVQPARPLYLAGLVPVPAMPFHDLSPEWQYWLLDNAENWHVAGVILLTLLVPAHAAAAIKHHFWNRDDVLEGMLPEVPDTRWHPGGPRYSGPEIPVPPRKDDG